MAIFGDFSAVTEKYVGGNNKEFKIVESELGKIISVIRSNFKPLSDRLNDTGGVVNTKSTADLITRGDSNRLIERQLKKFFGLKNFRLVWFNHSVPNAYTMPRSYTFLDKGQGKDGKYTNDKISVGVVLDVAIVSYCGMTAREIMAIILHEIGHNFYNSPYNLLMHLPISLGSFLSPKAMAEAAVGSVATLGVVGFWDFVNSKSDMPLIMKIQEHQDDILNKVFPKLYGFYNLFKETVFNFAPLAYFGQAAAIVLAFLKKVKVKMVLPKDILSFRAIFGYNAEKFSDKFATDHGYGLDLASGLNKLNNDSTIGKRIVNDVPIINTLADFLEVQSNIVRQVVDEHPPKQVRIRSGLDNLRKSLNDPNLDPELRKEISEQITQYEDFYFNTYLKLSENQNQRKIFTWAYSNLCEKIFGGKLDLRELSYALDPLKYK